MDFVTYLLYPRISPVIDLREHEEVRNRIFNMLVEQELLNSPRPIYFKSYTPTAKT